MALQIVSVGPDTAEQWREIHNLIVPPHQLTADEVRERLGRNRPLRPPSRPTAR